MCFRFGSCFNGGKTQDDYCRPSSPTDRSKGRKPPVATYGNLTPAVDAPRYAHGQGYAEHAHDRAYGGYAHDRAYAHAHNKVGDDHAGYRERLHEAADRENAMDHHTATTTVERY